MDSCQSRYLQTANKTTLLTRYKQLHGIAWGHQRSAKMVLKDIAVDLLSHMTGGTQPSGSQNHEEQEPGIPLEDKL